MDVDDRHRSNPLNTWIFKKLEGKERLKWFIKHVFVYAGMGILLFGYCVIGAATFRFLENDAIRAKRSKNQTAVVAKCKSQVEHYSTNNKTAFLHELYNVTEALLIQHVQESLDNDKKLQKKSIDSWVLATKKLINKYEEELKDTMTEHKKCGALEPESLWDFATAFLFAMTVITTIGYGNRTPSSAKGRVATLLFAMMGVPIMLFALRTIGREIANAIDSIYRHCKARYMRCRYGRDGDEPRTDEMESASVAPSMYVHHGRSLGDGSVAAPDNSMQIPIVTTTAPLEEGVASTEDDRRDGRRRSFAARKKLSIPLALVFGVTILYNAIGAWLFAHYESWSFLDGFYFTFITISTIGFGDLVPGVLSDKHIYGNTPEWLIDIVYFVYVLMGLIVIQMSFEVTRDTINAKFYTLGHSLGMVDHSKEEQAWEREQREREAYEERRRRRKQRRQRSRERSGDNSRDWLRRSLNLGSGSHLQPGSGWHVQPRSGSPSMRSAELGVGGSGASTAPSSAESMPRPTRPKSARSRQPPRDI